MKRALAILVVAALIPIFIVMAQTEPAEYDPSPPGSAGSGPPARRVRVVNFPDPQNVVGMVEVSNLAEIELGGAVEVTNFPVIQQVEGNVNIDNLPTDALGAITVSVANPLETYQAIELLSGDTHVAYTETLFLGPLNTAGFSTIGLRLIGDTCSSDYNDRVQGTVEWRWFPNQEFIDTTTSFDHRIGDNEQFKYYGATGVTYSNRSPSFVPIQGTEARIKVYNGRCYEGLTLNSVSVLLQR